MAKFRSPKMKLVRKKHQRKVINNLPKARVRKKQLLPGVALRSLPSSASEEVEEVDSDDEPSKKRSKKPTPSKDKVKATPVRRGGHQKNPVKYAEDSTSDVETAALSEGEDDDYYEP
ncbi:hypothetical protein NPIL_156331 [Nephila pilipes]|uniref:Uncharacterized protein n=1 Tax=Nephila pilipes TaxID=299642 RepID=A0A8X6NJJ0_NEPPI|nr:hypothetical protein NPIL_156331 [Nephila pilipes]